MALSAGSENISVANLAQDEKDDLGLLGNKPEAVKPTSAPIPTTIPTLRDSESGRFVKPPVQEPVVEEPQQVHPDYLYEAAAHFGIDREDADEIPFARLNAMVHKMNRQNLERQADESRARLVQEGQVRTPPPAPEPEPELDFGINPETGKPYTEEELDGPMLRVLKAQEKRLREQEKAIAARDQRDGERSRKQSFAELDDAFESLGEDDAKLFGSGPMSEITEEAHRVRRKAIVDQAKIDFSTATPKQIRAKIKAARDLLYGAAPAAQADPYDLNKKKNGKTVEEPPVRGKRISPEDWNRGGLIPPTRREAEELPDGEEKAVRNLEKKIGPGSQYDEDAEIKAGLLKKS